MVDKEIIIDETDISKCEFCNDGEYCHIYSGTADFKWMCKENEDCQIKNLLLKLKCKEQECEELGQAYLEINELLQEKTKECTNLKADREEALKQLEFVRTLNTVKEAEIRKLSKTLTEIKEMIPPPKGAKLHLVFEEILKKISEVENG